MSARRGELDLARGFGIVVVVLAHMHFAEAVSKVVCIYLPIFFVVSWILHRPGTAPMALLRRRLPALMVPYLVFGGAY